MKIKSAIRFEHSQFYEKQFSQFPPTMCLSAAVNLLVGKMCFQNLPLALSYYRKHL